MGVEKFPAKVLGLPKAHPEPRRQPFSLEGNVDDQIMTCYHACTLRLLFQAVRREHVVRIADEIPISHAVDVLETSAHNGTMQKFKDSRWLPYLIQYHCTADLSSQELSSSSFEV